MVWHECFHPTFNPFLCQGHDAAGAPQLWLRSRLPKSFDARPIACLSLAGDKTTSRPHGDKIRHCRPCSGYATMTFKLD